MSLVAEFNEYDVRAVYRFLAHEHETEIRYIQPAPTSIFVSGEDQFVAACKKLNGTTNVYVGINERVPGGTKDEDVVAVRAIVLDIDSIRAEGHEKDAATDEELAKAEEVADRIITYLVSVGWPSPVKCMSGNGYQLWQAIPCWKVTRDNWKDINERIKAYNREIAEEFQGEGVKIDNIGNLSRIIKVIGTMSMKGKGTPESPHRLSRVCGELVRVENRRLLKHLMSISLESTPKLVPSMNINKVEDGVIRSLIDVNPTLRKYYYGGLIGDRSKTDFILACKLIQCNVPIDKIYQVLMTRPNGKAQTHKKPDWYVNYTIDRALERVGHGRGGFKEL